jgi:hypothetical protein
MTLLIGRLFFHTSIMAQIAANSRLTSRGIGRL